MVWYQVQYPAKTEPVGDPSVFIEPVFFEAWNQPIQQPVIAKEFRFLIPSTFFVGEPDDFAVAVPDFGWFRPLGEPVRRIEYRYTLPSHFPIPWEEIISTDDGVNFAAWVQAITQPVLPIEFRYTFPSVFSQIEPGDFVTTTAKRPLKYLSLELGGDLSMTLTPVGDMLQASHVTISPIGAPPGNKGVMFEVSGGTLKVHVWDGSSWITLS